MRKAIGLGGLALGLLVWLGGPAGSQVPSPSPSPSPSPLVGEEECRSLGMPFAVGGSVLKAGADLYAGAGQCASCHGADGKGGGPSAADLQPPPPDLTNRDAWRYGTRHWQVFRSIRHGVPGTGMPAFGKAAGGPLSDEDLWLLTAYTMSLAWPPQTQALPSGLQFAVLRPGEGKEAVRGRLVLAHYTGWLTTGQKFDSSYDRGEPFDFVLGAGQVIRGWDEGVQGMREGELRQLVVPPQMGYGDRGVGPIPPGATLIFQVELVEVR